MNDRFTKTICLVFAALFILAGCERKYEKDLDVLARGPDVETISVPSDYAARAIEAAGGLNAWTKAIELQLDCVVTFFQPDGSYYLTEQRYEVYPWSNSIKIWSQEPQGRFVWQLSKGQFDVLEGADQFDGLPTAVGSYSFAEVILNIITAPVRFLDGSVEFARETTPVKTQGQWYYRIDRTTKPDAEPAERLSEAVFCQNRDSFRVDMIWLGHASREKFLRVRGYNYNVVEKEGVSVPAKIEIFGTDAEGNSRERVVEIDCHALRRTK